MKIKTNLTSGIVIGVFSIIFMLLVPREVPVPAYDNGGPSPRIIPYLVLAGMLLCSIGLILQSLVFKKEKIKVYDIKIEKSSIFILLNILLFGFLMLNFGFLVGVFVALPIMLFALGERKPFIYIFTLLGGVGVYFLFLEVFNITLPRMGG